ncbi:MAG TPA: hypothetical protein VLL97_00245, partial [Acidobacteriota bacterium]|nr:hypothetical protein [Acidobacteriota bacterium]
MGIRFDSFRARDFLRLIAPLSIAALLVAAFVLAPSTSSIDSTPTPAHADIDAGPIPAMLLAWPRSDTAVMTDAILAFRSVVERYEKEDYAGAMKLFPPEREAAATPIGDYILLYGARIRLMMKQYPEALELFRLAEKTFPRSPLLREFIMGQCQALLELNDPGAVLALLDRHEFSPTAESIYYRGRAVQLKGENETAAALFLEIFSDHPSSRFSAEAERGLSAVAPQALTGANNYVLRLQRAENLIKANQHSGARNLLAALGRVSAPDALTAQKQSLLLAEADFNLRNTQQALALIRKTKFTDPLL